MRCSHSLKHWLSLVSQLLRSNKMLMHTMQGSIKKSRMRVRGTNKGSWKALKVSCFLFWFNSAGDISSEFKTPTRRSSQGFCSLSVSSSATFSSSNSPVSSASSTEPELGFASASCANVLLKIECIDMPSSECFKPISEVTTCCLPGGHRHMLGKNIYSVSREKNNDTAMAEHNNFHKHKMQQLEAERHHSVIMSLKHQSGTARVMCFWLWLLHCEIIGQYELELNI